MTFLTTDEKNSKLTQLSKYKEFKLRDKKINQLS